MRAGQQKFFLIAIIRNSKLSGLIGNGNLGPKNRFESVFDWVFAGKLSLRLGSILRVDCGPLEVRIVG